MKKTRKFSAELFIKIALSIILVVCFVGSAVSSSLFLKILPLDNILIDESNLLVKDKCTAESFTKNQYSEVFVVNTVINDMSFFDDLTIESIKFENCDFRGCTINLPSSVTMVSFVNCNIDNFVGLNDNSNISSFHMNSCYAESLDGLRYLENMESLSIYYLGIESLEELRGLNNLKELYLIYTCVKSLEPLRNSNIEYLDITDSLNIEDFSPIKDMKNLKTLVVENGQMALTEDIFNYLNANGIENEFTKDDLKYKKQVKQIANNIFMDGMTDEEKIEATVNYVTENMVYDEKAPWDSELLSEYNTYALKYALEGTGCCRNYTALTTALLQEAGIEVYESINDSHIWNLVRLNEKFYWLDVTLIDGDAFEDVKESAGYMTDNFEMLGTATGTLPQSYYEKMCDSPNDELIGIPPNVDIIYNDTYLDTYTYSYIEDELSYMHTPFGILVVVSLVAIVVVSIIFKSIKKKKAKESLTEQCAESNINI